MADILLGTADDLGAPGVDPIYGHGLLDVARAFSANGNVSLIGTTGTSTVVTNSTVTFSPTWSWLPFGLASVSVYDRYGRDFTLAQAGRLQLRRTYDTIHQLLGRDLLGLGSQSDWAAAYFQNRHDTLGIAHFGSSADPVT